MSARWPPGEPPDEKGPRRDEQREPLNRCGPDHSTADSPRKAATRQPSELIARTGEQRSTLRLSFPVAAHD
jgi:hypothetical protein